MIYGNQPNLGIASNYHSIYNSPGISHNSNILRNGSIIL